MERESEIINLIFDHLAASKKKMWDICKLIFWHPFCLWNFWGVNKAEKSFSKVDYFMIAFTHMLQLPHCAMVSPLCMVLAITKEDLLWAYIQIWDISCSSAGFGRMNKFTIVLSVLFSVSDSKLEVAEWRWMAWRTPLSGRRSKNIFVVKSAKLAWHHFIKRYLWSLPFLLFVFVFLSECLKYQKSRFMSIF